MSSLGDGGSAHSIRLLAAYFDEHLNGTDDGALDAMLGAENDDPRRVDVLAD